MKWIRVTVSLTLCLSPTTRSHTGETRGAFLSPHSLFFCLLGVWFGHGPHHAVHQPLRGAVAVCHLRGAVLLVVYAALLSAV